jgi:hypothetical protein
VANETKNSKQPEGPVTPAQDAASIVKVEKLDPVEVHDVFGNRMVVRTRITYADGTIRIDN